MPGTADPRLERDITAILAETGQEGRRSKYNVNITGSQGVQIGDHNTQTNTFR